MKKVLFVLFILICRIGLLFAETKGTIVVSTETNLSNGGSVEVGIATYIYNGIIDQKYGTFTFKPYSNSGQSYYNGGWLTTKKGIKFQLKANSLEGYYFNKWEGKTEEAHELIYYQSGRWGNYDYTNQNPCTNDGVEIDYLDSGTKTYEYIAHFKPIEVISASGGTISTTGLNVNGTCNVTFNVTNNVDVDIKDFEVSMSAPAGFSIENTSYANGVFTVTIKYIDQNIHNVDGNPEIKAEITLTSKGGADGSDNKSQTATVIAKSDLTPAFTIAELFDFTDNAEVALNATVGSGSALYATPTNETGRATNNSWSAELSGEGASAFVVKETSNGKFVVNFTPTEAKSYEATLTSKVTYKDSKGREVITTQETTLKGTGTIVEVSEIKFNLNELSFGNQAVGYIKSETVAVSASNVDNNIVYSFGETAADFPFSYSAEAGSVTITTEAKAPGIYNATLTASADNTLTSEVDLTTATLPVSITVGLEKPILQGGSNKTDTYFLTWNSIQYATEYVIYAVEDETKTNVTSQATWMVKEGNLLTMSVPSTIGTNFVVEAKGEYKGETYTSQSDEVTINLESLLYYYVGPSVYVSGHELNGGKVYVDKGEAGVVENIENNAWVDKMEDGDSYAQSTPNVSFTYYAKVEDMTKYAFKGWSTTMYGEPTYFNNPLVVTSTMTEENNSADSRYLLMPYYAVFQSFYYKCPPVAVADPSRGSGYVYVSLSKATFDNCTQEDIAVGNQLIQVPAERDDYSYNVFYYARPLEGSEFVGWSTTSDGLSVVSNSREYIVSYKSTSKSADVPHVAAPLYAVFRHDIDIQQQDRMILYRNSEGEYNINDAQVLIDFQKGATLKAEIISGDVASFMLSNSSGSKMGNKITFDATQGLVKLLVLYRGDLGTAVGKKVEATLTATYDNGHTATRKLTVVVEEAPTITFFPTDGKGAYTIKMTNGSGINYVMDVTKRENLVVAVTHESMSNIEMALTSDVVDDDYYFFGWQVVEADGTMKYLSYDELFTYQFTKSVSVRAEFVHKDIAIYSIVGDETNTKYHDFAQVMKDAEKIYKSKGIYQEVVLNDYRGTTQVKKAFLPKGDYEIPNGVRLVIPCKTNKRFTENLSSTDYFQGAPAKTEYIRWVIEEGTNITVKGNGAICVLAQIACQGGDAPNGVPSNYGHIEMRENCNITFAESGMLYAYGYVTGPQSSSVIMKSGTTVKEMVQIYDWPGGTAMLEYYLGGTEKVFPISQFYVQNIEVPLVLEKGATEMVSAAILVSGITAFDFVFVGANSGMFRIAEGSFVKSYYPETDRLKFITKPDVISKKGSFTLANIALSINISGIPATIDSKNYVLPILHSYDFVMSEGTETNIMYDVAMLPSSTLHIEQGAIVNLNKGVNCFIYGEEYKKIVVDGKEQGYYAGYRELKPVVSRPGTMFTRNVSMLEDAKLTIDGKLNLLGSLYTTSGTRDPKFANITSNGGGQVVYSALGTVTQTYQLPNKKPGAIPVVPARLRNSDNTYVTPKASTTYTYKGGSWQTGALSEEAIIPTEVSYIPKFSVDNYSTSAYVSGEPSIGSLANVKTENGNITDWTAVKWSYSIVGENADQFRFTFGSEKPNGSVIFTPTSEGTKTATLCVTATYTKTLAMGTAKPNVTFTYTKEVRLTGNATYLQANTLAFADLSTVFVGQGAIALFAENSRNNTKDISIKIERHPNTNIDGDGGGNVDVSNDKSKITPKAVGEVTITAIQEADHTKNIAGTTITKRIKVTEAVEWNWGDLYFGMVNSNPVTIHNGATSWTLVEKTDAKNIINLQGTSPNYTATIADQIAGEYEVTFTYSDNKGVTKDFISTVYANPRYLRVDVNSDVVYRAVTLSANENVSFNDETKAVQFTSTAQNISQWKMTFIGVPDKINFIPVGTNTWQIEESTNGVNWTTSMSWKYLTENEPFEMSLLPSTRYVRISYGAGNTDVASLKELYITELSDVKADVNKIYMPIDGVNNAVKEVVLTYANTGMLSVKTTNTEDFSVKFSDSDDEATDAIFIPATDDENPFGIKGIEVVCSAKKVPQEMPELQVYNGSQLVLQIPIHAYSFPQELPIKLATDEPAGGDRYYYVTTHSHNAEWDGTDGVRKITMNNAVSDAAPYVTFAFNGNPTFISFDYTSSAKGTWVIEQSTDGKDWSTAMPVEGDVMASGKLKRTVSTSSKYIRVIYESDYAEKIEVTNLTIVGGASVVVNPIKLQLDYDVAKQLTLTAINLTAINIATSSSNFTVTPTTTNAYAQTLSLNTTTNPNQLGENKMGDIVLDVKWTGSSMVEYGKITITNPNDGNAVLATVELTGIKNSITSSSLGIKTGVPTGYTLNGTFEGSSHRPVDISAAFSATDNKPLFDYVVIYGETTTNNGQTTITTPNRNAGSNAKTPYYIYKKSADGNSYELDMLVENANSSRKAWSQNDDDAVVVEEGKTSVSMYITGFCPYATTGYTKEDEGVWYFRANGGQSIDVYLEDCYIYSRAKTFDGHTFADRQDGNSFVDSYSRGTGAVLVFACNEKETTPMKVTIHTLDNNLLKSNYGCFLQSIAGRAFQASSPVQIRLIDDTYAQASYTVLNFTDEWPASKHAKTGDGVRTNGFISLQKQVNNAPSIDMGNANTVVNFNGGQVELQNAQIVSYNYASSLAICPRSGKFAGVFLAYGLGTDDVGGTVNFNDGTTTVQPMWVSPTYFESYLCDKDEYGNYITNSKGEYLTTCLRTPANTFVTGGSHCMMRACPTPKSQGGAPKDKPGDEGKLLGLYKYPKNPDSGKKGGWSDGTNGLVTPTEGNVPTGYKVESVTPNNNGTVSDDDDYLNFWFDPTFEPSAQPEINKEISFWKTCMTYIEAEYAGEGGHAGGDATVAFAGGTQTEIVKNLLYCQLDENILEVIGGENYYAPVKNPTPAAGNGMEAYLPVHPSRVGDDDGEENGKYGQNLQRYILNGESYQVEDRIYYITTATADVWMMFTAPFDVEKIYVVETYPESQLEQTPIKQGATGPLTKRESVMLEQAKHNADFASFFAVTIALGQDKDFNTIYNEWLNWAKIQDNYTTGKYDSRGMWPLEPYWATDLNEDGIEESNWATANFYLNHNNDYWEEKGDGIGGDSDFITKWERFTPSPDPKQGDPLLLKGETYSMLFPYCVGCEGKTNSLDRGYWDYWSGKFLIFESTMKTKDENNNVVPHTIYGADYVDENKAGNIFNGFNSGSDAALLGNPTFAMMTSTNKNIYTYIPSLPGKNDGNFYAVDSDEDGYINIEIAPTNSFLLTKVEAPAGYKIRSISYSGKINYEATDEGGNGGDDLGTDNHVPTINGGSDIFVTSTFEGINIAVAEPQYVGVFAANGTLLFNGWVENSVNVALMNKGVYVVVGENVSVKVIY